MAQLNPGDRLKVKGEGCILTFEVKKVDEDRNLFLIQLLEVERNEQPESGDGVPF